MRAARSILVLLVLAAIGGCGREGTGLTGRIDHAEGGGGKTKIVVEVKNTRAISTSGSCVVTRVSADASIARRVVLDDLAPGERVTMGVTFSDRVSGRPTRHVVDCDRDGKMDRWPGHRPGTIDRISTPWRLLREEGTRLTVLAASGGCETFERVDVRETRSGVELKALSVHKTPPSTTSSPDPSGRSEVIPGSCTGELRLDVVAVCLKSPAGSRRLSHARISPDGPPQRVIEGYLSPFLKTSAARRCS